MKALFDSVADVSGRVFFFFFKQRTGLAIGLVTKQLRRPRFSGTEATDWTTEGANKQ